MEDGVKGTVLASLIRLFLSTAVNMQKVGLRTKKLFWCTKILMTTIKKSKSSYLNSVGRDFQWIGMRNFLVQLQKKKKVKYKRVIRKSNKDISKEMHVKCSKYLQGQSHFVNYIWDIKKSEMIVLFCFFKCLNIMQTKERLTYEDLWLMDLTQLFHADWGGLHTSWRSIIRWSDLLFPQNSFLSMFYKLLQIYLIRKHLFLQ